MKNLMLSILLLAFFSCQQAEKKDTKEHQPKILYDKNKDYETLMFSKYNSSNLKVEDKVFFPYSRGIYLDTIVATTRYFYDGNKNLKEELRINETYKDTAITLYKYNSNNKLVLKVIVDHNKDTALIVKNDYTENRGNVIIRTTKLEKDPLARVKSEIPFDTIISMTEEKYSDTLVIKIINYSTNEGKLEFNSSTFYKYDNESKLIKRFTINKAGDTTSWKNIEYRNGKIIKEDFYMRYGNYLVSTLYDNQGYEDKTITKNFTTGETDTSFYKCDEKGNVIFYKWK